MFSWENAICIQYICIVCIFAVHTSIFACQVPGCFYLSVSAAKCVGGFSVNNVVSLPQVIVDLREFRSELPSLIYKRGYELVPLTLVVRSHFIYILSCYYTFTTSV